MYPFELEFAHRDIQKEEYDCYNHHQISWIKTLFYTRDEPFENFIALCVSNCTAVPFPEAANDCIKAIRSVSLNILYSSE